ncbi:MAG: carbamoyltransferase, partial [Gemmatimonadetes bacterium]|nr:carbamoyltransferase [Gemmatimonadota bacterium]
MLILGMSPLDKDSTVSIHEDGRITWAIAEERLSRVKLQDGFPKLAWDEIFKRAGVNPSEVDKIAYPFFEGRVEARMIWDGFRAELSRNTGASLRECHQAMKKIAGPGRVPSPGLPVRFEGYQNYMEKDWTRHVLYKLTSSTVMADRLTHLVRYWRWCINAAKDHEMWSRMLEDGLRERGMLEKLVRVEHHLAHAANAYYTSGYEEALCLSIDAYGSGMTSAVAVGRRGRPIEVLHRTPFPHSFGAYYEQLTSALGFKPNRHEGKILGLAAYGDPNLLMDVVRARLEESPEEVRINGTMNAFFARLLTLRYTKQDVAAAHQTAMEKAVSQVVKYWVQKTGIKNVVLSGGVVANVKLNQRIFETEGVEKVFIHPGMGDGGLGTGAAFLLEEQAGGMDSYTLDNVYFGPEYTEDEMRRELEKAELPFERFDDVEEKIADLVSNDIVVGRFNGRMEYGPRALGNRTVMYRAADPTVNSWLNQRLGRTEFMPFAPATMYEHRRDNYKNIDGAEYTAQFMTITFDCTDQMLKDNPAAVHVDGTARPQLVTAESNPSFHKVLSAFKARTGVPTLINTSFNM